MCLRVPRTILQACLGIQKEVHGIKRKGERRGEEEGARGKEEALGGTPAFPVLVKKADGTGQGKEGTNRLMLSWGEKTLVKKQ